MQWYRLPDYRILFCVVLLYLLIHLELAPTQYVSKATVEMPATV